MPPFHPAGGAPFVQERESEGERYPSTPTPRFPRTEQIIYKTRRNQRILGISGGCRDNVGLEYGSGGLRSVRRSHISKVCAPLMLACRRVYMIFSVHVAHETKNTPFFSQCRLLTQTLLFSIGNLKNTPNFFSVHVGHGTKKNPNISPGTYLSRGNWCFYPNPTEIHPKNFPRCMLVTQTLVLVTKIPGFSPRT